MFDQAMARIAGRFKRVEPWATARAFVLALLSGVERKNCRRLAEQAGHARPGPMQRLLRSTRWDADAVRADVRAYVIEHLGVDDGVLIVDETGFLKKGTASAGVHRQYTGTAGSTCPKPRGARTPSAEPAPACPTKRSSLPSPRWPGR